MLSSRRNPIWLVTTDPWFQLQILHKPMRETRTVEESWKDGTDFSEQFTLIFHEYLPLLGLRPHFIIHHLLAFFDSFSSISLTFFVGPFLLDWTLVPNLNHPHVSPSACLSFCLSVCHAGTTWNAHGVSVGARITPHSSRDNDKSSRTCIFQEMLAYRWLCNNALQHPLLLF